MRPQSVKPCRPLPPITTTYSSALAKKLLGSNWPRAFHRRMRFMRRPRAQGYHVRRQNYCIPNPNPRPRPQPGDNQFAAAKPLYPPSSLIHPRPQVPRPRRCQGFSDGRATGRCHDGDRQRQPPALPFALTLSFALTPTPTQAAAADKPLLLLSLPTLREYLLHALRPEAMRQPPNTEAMRHSEGLRPEATSRATAAGATVEDSNADEDMAESSAIDAWWDAERVLDDFVFLTFKC